MKTALLPATRIEPALRRELEAALNEGETLSAFIEASVRRQVYLREAQRAFIARGLAAERQADAQNDWLDSDDVIKDVAALAARLGKSSKRRTK